MPVGLDLRALGDREADLGEDRDGLEADLREQVQLAAAVGAARQGHVDDPGQILGPGRGHQVVELARDRGLDLVLDLVDHLADQRPVGGRQAPQLLHELRDLALLAEELGLRGPDRLLVVERRDERGELFAAALELLDELSGDRHRRSVRPGTPEKRRAPRCLHDARWLAAAETRAIPRQRRRPGRPPGR
jgi:hypothetical protein